MEDIVNEAEETIALKAAVLGFGAALVYVAENHGGLDSLQEMVTLFGEGDAAGAYVIATATAKEVLGSTSDALLERVEWELGR